MKRRFSKMECVNQHRSLTPRKKFQLELLERRDLMTASPFDPLAGLSSTACGCPICTGQGLSEFVGATANAGTAGGGIAAAAGAKYSLTSLPSLNSLPGATAQLVLDFNGNTLASWGGDTNVVTPAYDIDGDASTFNDQELANIREIWARVAEDYAPFNINVTTVDPGNLNNKVVAKVAIGGSYSDWFGSGAGGVAYVGGFYNSASNVGFAFAKNLGAGNPRTVAEAVSHEAGHLFGLDHQAKWSGSTLVDEYHEGDANWAPIMGVGYYSAVTTWHNGTTPDGPTVLQDDMTILAGTLNGFGYRNNAMGTQASAGSLGTTGSFHVGGVIARNTDQQWWSFSTAGGAVALNLNTIGTGANLDTVLEIRNSAGQVLHTSNLTTSLNSSLSVTLGSGTYYAVARSTGVYGRVGQYALLGSFVPSGGTATPAPEVTVLQGATSVADGGSVSYGSTTVGTVVDRVFTIRNDGNAALTLQAINGTTLPAGFTLVANIGATTLQAGQTTTFTVRMSATTAGSYSGVVRFNSNDANEAVYDINVSGVVTTVAPPPPSGARIIDNGGTGYVQTGSWTSVGGLGRDNDMAYTASTSPFSSAQWTANGLAAGTYRIAVTYRPGGFAATNTRFWFGDEAATRGGTLVNQRITPSSFVADGSSWQTIGNVTLSGGRQQLWVYTSNNGVNGNVIADAVRFERISAAPQAANLAGTAAAIAQHLADDAMSAWGRRR